jgi:adenylate cyclase
MKPLFRFTAFRLGLMVTLGMVLLYYGAGQTGLERNLEAKTLDLRFRWRGIRSPGSQVVLVVIDDASIAELGRWPWSRRRFAALVRRLDAAGARVIAFNMLFTEPETSAAHDELRSLKATFEALHVSRQNPRLATFYRTLVAMTEAADPDREFARSIQNAGKVILAYAFEMTPAQPTEGGSPRPPPAFLARTAYRAMQHATPETSALVPHAVDVLPPIDRLGQRARTLGHINAGLDTDGALRYDYLVVAYAGAYYPSLPVQAVRLFLGLTPEEVRVQLGRGVQLGPRFVPTDRAMRLLVNYYGPRRTFPTYSAADVLQDRLPEALFHDKIVLIGGMAVGLGETFVTPFSSEFPGLEKHATVIANILQGAFLQRRGGTMLLDVLCLVFLGLAVGWVGSRFPLLPGWLCAVGFGGFYVMLNYLAFARLGLWINLTFPLATVICTQVAITIHRSLTEERQKRQIRRAFQYYLHPSVVEQVTQHPELLTLGGEERELTVLFSDIRGFTRLSEGLAPPELVRLLNEYLSAMTQVVLDDEGLLDKYIGDAIMAVYGAPITMSDHAYRACHTAVSMLERLRALRADWRARGFPAIDIGVGIHTGPMVVGNMGSDLRFDYTVMGDAVNLGSRLEGATKTYGTRIIVSESTWSQVSDRIATRELDVVRVQGKATPVRIFEVVGFPPLPAAQAQLIQQFERGLQAYRARQWQAARQCFEQVLARHADDRPSRLYLQRCAAFERTPPPANWDGVYGMQSK